MPWRNPDIWQWVPFVGLAVGTKNSYHPVIVRLLEAGIIGAVVTWGTVQVLGNDIAWIKSTMQQQTQQQNVRIERLEALYLKR